MARFRVWGTCGAIACSTRHPIGAAALRLEAYAGLPFEKLWTRGVLSGGVRFGYQ